MMNSSGHAILASNWQNKTCLQAQIQEIQSHAQISTGMSGADDEHGAEAALQYYKEKRRPKLTYHN